jgi:hypothetical protein
VGVSRRFPSGQARGRYDSNLDIHTDFANRGSVGCLRRNFVFVRTHHAEARMRQSDLSLRARRWHHGRIICQAGRSFKPEKHAERLRGLGDSSGDEDGSDAMKDWEIIPDNLSKAGWSWGCLSAVDRDGRTIWIVDAHRGDGKRFVVHADEILTAFLELETAVCIRLLTDQI